MEERSINRTVALLMAGMLLSACQTTQGHSRLDPDVAAKAAEVRAKYAEQRRQQQLSEQITQSQIDRETDAFLADFKEENTKIAHLTVDAKIAIEALGARSVTCASNPWNEAVRHIEDLEAIADKRRKLLSLDTGIYRWSNVRRANQLNFNLSTEGALTARLDLADKALAKACLDIADTHYRVVVARYVGSAYAAYRDRAKIGIEDVRQKRTR